MSLNSSTVIFMHRMKKICFIRSHRKTNMTHNKIKQIQSLPLRKGPDLEEINKAVDLIIFSYSFTGQMITLDGGEHLKWEVKKGKIYKE